MAHTTRTSFGIATAPMQVGYPDILRVWREADTVPEIEHAWLFDHLMPIGGDPNGPVFEGWTLLSALAAQTRRLRLGLLVTSNRIRPPAMLAKIAATVDIVSDGRLDFGIGVGSRPDHPLARREYAAHGLPFHDSAHAVGSLAEACTVIRRLWTEDEPFDFHGSYLDLVGALCNPKPVQRPHPPILIGGRSAATLRIVAQHADLWNIPGGDIEDVISRSALLDRYCAEIGRDPASITRSILLTALVRPPRHDPGRRRPSGRRRLPPHRPGPVTALPDPCRSVDRREDHHHAGLNYTSPSSTKPEPSRLRTKGRRQVRGPPDRSGACLRSPGSVVVGTGARGPDVAPRSDWGRPSMSARQRRPAGGAQDLQRRSQIARPNQPSPR